MHGHRGVLAEVAALGLLVLWISSRSSWLHSKWVLPREAWSQVLVDDIRRPLRYVILKCERLILRAVPRLDFDQIVLAKWLEWLLLARIDLRGVWNEYGLAGVSFLIVLQPAIVFRQAPCHILREPNVGIAPFDSRLIAVPREVASRSAPWVRRRTSAPTHS